jgi:hypothetical protein
VCLSARVDKAMNSDTPREGLKEKTSAPKRGKPKYQPTPADQARVQNLAALGATHADIAMCIGTKGIDEKTLRKHFRRELDTSLMEVKALAMSKLVASIKNGDSRAICFFLKSRCGWRETQALSHQMLDENGMPANNRLEITFSRVEGRADGR